MTIDVTVVTPAYNTAAYLKQTIASVAAQTGLRFEHILIDDCSTDETPDMIRAAAAQHPHITALFQDENQGQARARNRGIDAARGTYIAFLDSDDLLASPTALADWFAAAKANDADLVAGQYQLFLDGKAPVPTIDHAAFDPRTAVTIATMPELVNYTSCWQFLMKRSFLNAHDIRFSRRLRQREDRPFFTQALIAARSVNVIGDELILYRVRDGSTMRSPDARQMGLFAIHLQIVDAAMQQAAALPGTQAYVAANQLYYLETIHQYWGKLFQDPAIRDTPEATAFLKACACLSWSEASTLQDRALARRPTPDLRSGFYDMLRLLLIAQMTPAVIELLATRNLSLSHRQALYHWLATEGVLDAVRAQRKTLADRFLRQTPLPPLTPEQQTQLPAKSTLPPIYLHCGQTKTGSSALQSFFETNRFALLNDHGVYYPFAGIETGAGARAHRTSGHAGLIGGLLNGDTAGLDLLRAEIATLTTPPRAIFLSAENIISDRFWDEGRAPAKLAAAFDGCDIRPIAYLRRQDDWLESMYVESITSPGMRECDPVDAYIARQRAQGLLSYSGIAGALAQAFGADKLTLHSYDHALQHGGGTIHDFLTTIGMTACDPASYDAPDAKMRNPSTSKLAAILMRRANATPLPQTIAAQLNTRLAALAKAHAINEKGLGFIDRTQRAAIMHALSDDNAAFYAAHIPDARDVPQAAPKAMRSLHDADAFTPPVQEGFDRLMARATVLAQASAQATRTAVTRQAWHAVLRHLLNPVVALRALTSKTHRKALIQGLFIARSAWFDARFYRQTYPDALPFPGGAAMHYVLHGGDMGYDPSPLFSTRGYNLASADVASSGVNPLYHFIRWGRDEGRSPGVDGDADWQDGDTRP